MSAYAKSWLTCCQNQTNQKFEGMSPNLSLLIQLGNEINALSPTQEIDLTQDFLLHVGSGLMN